MEKLQQHYQLYTSQDREVWKTLFQRQEKNLEHRVSRMYADARNEIGFNAYAIPEFDQVNSRLRNKTGWQLEVVPAIVPEKDFFELLQQKKFPATTWLRQPAQLDYLEEPDMFHDVFGHVPLLMNKKYVDFFEGLAHLALTHIGHPQVIKSLGRIYWFTVEFGLILEDNHTKIYGAGIISSFGETNHAMSQQVRHHVFDVKNIMHRPFINSEMQYDYFVIPSLQKLYDSLGEIEKEMRSIVQHEKITI